MAEQRRQLFRSDALRRRAAAQDRAVLPRLVRPPVFLLAWLLVLLLVAAGVLVWATTVPVYAAGTGVLALRADDADLVLFLDPAEQTHLAAGQPVLLTIAPHQPALAGKIVRVDPRVLGPDAARAAYGLTGAAGLAVTQPASVALARLDDAGDHSNATGSIGPVRVRVGSQRVASLLPIIGRFLKGH